MPATDPLTRHTDPYQRCTCGWRRFRDVPVDVVQTVQRWVFFESVGELVTEGLGEPLMQEDGTEITNEDLSSITQEEGTSLVLPPEPPSGLGSTPLGLFFGAGESGLWGLFQGTFRSCGLNVVCESCTRVRSSKVLSTGVIFGGYRQGAKFFVVASDVDQTGAWELEFRGPVTLTASLKRSIAPMLPLLSTETPLQGPLEDLPAGAAVAAYLMEAQIPSAPIEGSYEVVVLNRRCGFEEVLGTVNLEVGVVVLNPYDADWNGVPERWRHENWAVLPAPSQPYFGSVKGIPFDKVDGVLEYDARFGTTPDVQGFTHNGSGVPAEYAVGPGGVLQVNTGGGGADSYWTETLVLGSSPEQIYMYTNYRIESAGGSGGDAEGFGFLGRYSVAADTTWLGVRFHWTGPEFQPTEIDGSNHSTFSAAKTDVGTWQRSAAARCPSESNNYTWHAGLFDTGFSYGSDIGAPSEDRLDLQFGDFAGSGVVGQVRNVVASVGGRFMRAWFRAYATVTSPVLRLYLTSDLDGSGEVLARFQVRYGPLNLYSVPASEQGVSVSFASRNQIIEVPLQLSGLTANQPFVFTVERDWDHVDDRTRATVWLMEATVRGA